MRRARHALPPWRRGPGSLSRRGGGPPLPPTHGRRAAIRAGARVISMPGITEDLLRDGGLSADWGKIHEVVRRTARRLRGVRDVHLTSGAGTDLSLSLAGRDWIVGATGRLVIDAYFEDRLREPATVQVTGGHATRVVGAPTAVEAMNRGGKEGRALGRFGFGLNPQARVTGPHLEAEKGIGGAHPRLGD